jgi:hypothetical protein
MKKGFALVLAAVLVLLACSALAEGPMTEKEIKYGSFTLGTSTFADLKASASISNISYTYYNAFTTRTIADARNDIPRNILRYDGRAAAGMSVYLQQFEPVKVAGYDNVSQTFYFHFPIENGSYSQDDSKAVLMVGSYRFDTWNMDASTVFEDLKGKLTKTYGEPWLDTKDADEIWGELVIPDGMNWFQEDENYKVEKYDPTYVVWKSSANGAMLVLRKSKTPWDEQYSVEIFYMDPSRDAEYIALSGVPGQSGVSDSTDGL